MLRFMLHGKDNTPFLIANIWLEKSSCKMTITPSLLGHKINYLQKLV